MFLNILSISVLVDSVIPVGILIRGVHENDIIVSRKVMQGHLRCPIIRCVPKHENEGHDSWTTWSSTAWNAN